MVGKDRTGLVMALTLSVLGVPESAIVDDYAKSGAAYKQLDDKDAMVGALAQVCHGYFVCDELVAFLRIFLGIVVFSGARTDNKRERRTLARGNYRKKKRQPFVELCPTAVRRRRPHYAAQVAPPFFGVKV